MRGLRLTVAPIPNVYILGYGIRFEQALLNLLDNAVKFNRENGEVRVEVRSRPDGPVEIVISDTGVGIPPGGSVAGFRTLLPGGQGEIPASRGTGLGLSIVKHAIEQMNGTIAVESETGKGSKFTITLPRQERRT